MDWAGNINLAILDIYLGYILSVATKGTILRVDQKEPAEVTQKEYPGR